jgi:hypothetical protein
MVMGGMPHYLEKILPGESGVWIKIFSYPDLKPKRAYL